MSDARPPTIDATQELADLGAALDQSEHLRTHSDLRRRVASVSGWSIEQHLYHLALSTDLALNNVRSIGRGSGALVTFDGGPNALALEVLNRESYPRGAAEAPRMVRPPDSVDADFLRDELVRARAGLDAVRLELEAVRASEARVPHQHLGELSGDQWLRFARTHAHHHLDIIADIEAAP